jgi:hypothetical protein
MQVIQLEGCVIVFEIKIVMGFDVFYILELLDGCHCFITKH